MKSILGLTLALLLPACGAVQDRDSRSEGDQARDQALAIFVDRSITDRVDGRDGDNTDWKYVDVVDPGRLRLSVSFDTPEQLEGAEVAFFDEFGSRLDRFVVTQNQSNYVFAREVEKIPNKFFVRVFADDGKSVYTVGATLAYAPRAAAPEPVAAPPPEPIVAAPQPKPRKRRRARRRPRKVAPPPPKPKPVASSIKGKVVRVIAGDGYVTITIRVSGNATVPLGATGTVFKNGAPLEAPLRVLKVSGRNVTARVKLPPGKFSGKLTAKIRL